MGKLLGQIVLATIIEISVEPGDILNKHRTIESFSESECWNFFETRKSDLYRLCKVLKLTERCILDNGSSMPGEEILLIGLYELVSGSDQYEIAVNIFGREQTQQSRAFKFFVNHIYNNFLDLVTNNLDWWYNNGYLRESMEAIKRKIGGNANFSTCGFLDCNCLETARPGGGPMQEGSDAERWDPLIQASFYNGWKSIHGLKHQTFDIAYGMTVDLYGPHSLRRNDLRLL